MQYLKDEVREKIINNALVEFNEKGYMGASIRKIARNAGTSVGNLYKYFQSKEALYECVLENVYNQLMNYIFQFSKVEKNDKAQSIFTELMEKIMGMFEQDSIRLSVLLNKSEGSKYENCKLMFINFITETVTRNIEYCIADKGMKIKDDYLIYVLSYSLVDSICLILREKNDGMEIKELILKLIDIFYNDLENKLNIEYF